MFVSKIKKVLRRETCNSCEFQRGYFKLFGITLIRRSKQCKICKCSIYAKTLFKASECPKGKW